MLHLFAETDTGKVRDNNEDRFLIANILNDGDRKLSEKLSIAANKKPVFLMVSDGMGGAAAGEIASSMAVIAMRNQDCEFISTYTDIRNCLDAVLQSANQEILKYANENPTLFGMGATATTAAIYKNKVLIAQVGDSRAYLFRENELKQITVDQTLVNELVVAGRITEEEAEIHPRRNVITQALGTQHFLNVAFYSEKLLPNDRLMLCSDGLTEMIKRNELKSILNSIKDTKKCCEYLVERANQLGGVDNITAVLADVIEIDS